MTEPWITAAPDTQLARRLAEQGDQPEPLFEAASAAASEVLAEDRDRLALRIHALGAAIDKAEQGGATVVRIDLVRAHLGRSRPAARTTGRPPR